MRGSDGKRSTDEKQIARERMEAMGSMIAAVAHEVRNPLFAISATVDAFVARFGERPEYGQHVAALRAEVDRLTCFMQGLLDYARPDQLHLQGRDLSPCVFRAVRECEVAKATKDVRIAVREHGTLATVSADEIQITQAFRNLLENAIHYSPRNGTVVVELMPVERGGAAWVRCSIRDSGPGVLDQDLPFIFEPFFTRRSGGTGLGLAIVKRIVLSHDGNIEARNQPTGGLEVAIELPCTPAS